MRDIISTTVASALDKAVQHVPLRRVKRKGIAWQEVDFAGFRLR